MSVNPLRHAAVMGACAASVPAEAECPITALGGGADSDGSGLRVRRRMDFLTVAVDVVRVFNQLGFVRRSWL